MPDYEALRATMVASQVAPNEVVDGRVQAVMALVPRERFVPAGRRALAYADSALEVAPGRFIPDPRTFAKLLMLARVGDGDHVLDVGCASGYSAAVLAGLCRDVVALEEDTDLVRAAEENLRLLAGPNVAVVQGALTGGCPRKAPYDVIVVEGGVERVPQALLSQLAEGGRLAAVVQVGQQGRAQLFVREKGCVGSQVGFDGSLPLLRGFRNPVGFVF